MSTPTTIAAADPPSTAQKPGCSNTSPDVARGSTSRRSRSDQSRRTMRWYGASPGAVTVT